MPIFRENNLGPNHTSVPSFSQICGLPYLTKVQRPGRESTPANLLCCVSSSFPLSTSPSRHVIDPTTSVALPTHQLCGLSGNSDTSTDQNITTSSSSLCPSRTHHHHDYTCRYRCVSLVRIYRLTAWLTDTPGH